MNKEKLEQQASMLNKYLTGHDPAEERVQAISNTIIGAAVFVSGVLLIKGIRGLYKHYKAKAKSKGANSRQASRVAAGATLKSIRSVKAKAKNDPKAMNRIASVEQQLIERIKKTKKK